MIDQVFLRYDTTKMSRLVLGQLDGLVDPDPMAVEYLKSLRHGLWNKAYQYVSVRLRGIDFTYNVAETQYTSKGMFFKITAPGDENVPFDGLFKDGNGLFVGRSDSRTHLVSVQNPKIAEICVMLKPTEAEVKGIAGYRVDSNGKRINPPTKAITAMAMLGALTLPLGNYDGK